MKFCVIRHPDLTNPGTCPESALDHHRGMGWFRVSDWREGPEYFHLPDFAEVFEDLDPAPEPAADAPEAITEPASAPAAPVRKTSKEKAA